MARKCTLSEEQLERICELREAGISFKRIAYAVGCSENQARWWARERGAIGPLDRHAFERPQARPRTIIRNGRPVVPFSPAERAVLRSAEKPNHYRLGRQLGRNPSSIRAFYAIDARRQAIAEEAGL